MRVTSKIKAGTVWANQYAALDVSSVVSKLCRSFVMVWLIAIARRTFRRLQGLRLGTRTWIGGSGQLSHYQGSFLVLLRGPGCMKTNFLGVSLFTTTTETRQAGRWYFECDTKRCNYFIIVVHNKTISSPYLLRMLIEAALSLTTLGYRGSPGL